MLFVEILRDVFYFVANVPFNFSAAHLISVANNSTLFPFIFLKVCVYTSEYKIEKVKNIYTNQTRV